MEINESGIKGLTPKDLYRDGNGVFGKNRRYLFRALTKLVSSKHIWREEISYKEPRYKITLEDQKIKDILSESSARRDAAFENMLKIIKIKSKSSENLFIKLYPLERLVPPEKAIRTSLLPCNWDM